MTKAAHAMCVCVCVCEGVKGCMGVWVKGQDENSDDCTMGSAYLEFVLL